MGKFSTWIKESNAKAKAYQHEHKHDMVLDVWRITGDNLHKGLQKWNLKGATAELENGANIGSRITATRVVTGAVLFGPVGAIIGGMAKKDRNKLYITVTYANGDAGVIEAKAKDEAKARQFVQAINKIGARV